MSSTRQGISRRLYLDNAATSSPKPPAMLAAMVDYVQRLGGSPGRGAYHEAREAGRLVDECRARICTLIGARDPDHVIFTLNTSDALNLAIKGMVEGALAEGRERVHIITTDMDHNSVLRPLNALSERTGERVAHTRIEADARTQRVDPEAIRRAIEGNPGTLLVALNHASNVTGTIQDARAIGAICREAGVCFLLDAAQSLGHIPVDVDDLSVDLLAFPGHKGLLGPSGTGGLWIRPGMERRVATLREGGTGSRSEDDVQPEALPDKYEPGSPNAMGIIGLGEGVRFLLEFEHAGLRGIEAIRAHERELMGAFLEGIEGVEGLTLFGPRDVDGRVGVFTIAIEGLGAHECSAILESEFGVLTRAGIHCAPGAHETIGTTDQSGAVRLSLGPFLTVEDVRYAAGALVEVARAGAAV